MLLNRLDGTFSGPVTCLVTTPVYSHDRQAVVIPPGARLLGSVAPVQGWGDARLAVSFHRLVLPTDAELFLFGQTEGEASGAEPAPPSLSEAPTGGDVLTKGQVGFSGAYGYIVE